jgi:hypothetical protein
MQISREKCESSDGGKSRVEEKRRRKRMIAR